MAVKCPPDRLLFPCKCHHNEHIICTESMTYSLMHVFRAIGQSMYQSMNIHYHLSSSSSSSIDKTSDHQPPIPLFNELILSNSYWNELDDNLFQYVRFQRIIMIDMKSLIRIHSNAFNGTNNDVQYLEIKGENKLGQKYINQLFDALSSLQMAREMRLELNQLDMIPSYAFRDIQMNYPSSSSSSFDQQNMVENWNIMNRRRIRLERLHIISKSLTQISSYAFYELNTLRSIRIHSKHNDGLQRISAHAFDLAQPLSHPLTIDLRKNQLKLSSFELDAFQQVNRPVHLDLSENNLTSIPQTIFERFLNTDVKNTIRIGETNPLRCDDCYLYWLLKDRQIYSSQIHDAICQSINANLWRLDESTFRPCSQDEHYQPQLIFRNSAHSIHQQLSSSTMTNTKQPNRHHHYYHLTFLFSSFIMILLI
ncbi:leucine rich repeat containing protein [Dermatophagoides farinae]|uniref:Leucine rich repeat containing protein n=2 Tax=Dermatophagoides farinae TaxID=6954 RepID=A0A9D4P1Q3_DERFA|nr:leucine rich repeat containing protein [Dermatophagoides farinae]